MSCMDARLLDCFLSDAKIVSAHWWLIIGIASNNNNGLIRQCLSEDGGLLANTKT